MSNYQDKNNNLDEENELQLIIGRNPVIEALKANKLIDTIYINPEAKGSITLICRLAKEKGINVKIGYHTIGSSLHQNAGSNYRLAR